MNYVVEKNVPMPRSRNERGAYKYPFETMQVGDSFIAEKGAQYAAYAHAKRNQVKFCSRVVQGTNSVRVWRIA